MNEMFLLALVVGVAKFGSAMSLQTGSGALASAASVVLDPRALFYGSKPPGVEDG